MLTVLVGLVGAVVLASVAGARRTSSSLERFEDETRSANLEIDAGETTPAELREFARTPNVAAVAPLRQIAIFPDADGYVFFPTAGPENDAFGTTVDRARVIEGRQARAADELTVGEQLAEQLHLDVGDQMRFVSFSPEQLTQEMTGFDPQGPRVSLRIVGIVRRPLDLGGRGAAGGVIVPTRAFTDTTRDTIASFGGTVLRIRTVHGASDVPQVAAAARKIFGDDESFALLNLNIEGAGIQSAIDVTTTGLWVLAAVAGAAGLVAIGIALSRYMAHGEADEPVLRALGCRWRDRWTATFAAALPVAVGGAAIALVGAALTSPIFPLGVARDAEPDPGFDVDVIALAGGAVLAVVVVLAVAAVAAAGATRRVERERARPALPTATATRAGLPTTMSTGIGFALERGQGRGGVPVRSSLVGAAFGVLGIVAALLLGASLDRLVTTPAQYGWTWDYVATDSHAADDQTCGSKKPFAHDRIVVAVAVLCTGSVVVDGHPAAAYGFQHVRGDIAPRVIDGRAPQTAREITLGQATLDKTGKEVGDVVTTRGADGAKKFRIVGTTVFPPIPNSDSQPLADGVEFTKAGFVSVGAGSDDSTLVQIAPGVDDEHARKHLAAVGDGFAGDATIVPAEIERLRQIDRLPMVLAAFIATVALVAVGYTLLTAVRRRRHDLAILKTLGYRRGQVRATVAWHATTVGVIGLVVGVPLGIVLGRLLWQLIADDLGVTRGVTVPALALVAVGVGVLLVVNVAAALPTRTAARTRPSIVLRSE